MIPAYIHWEYGKGKARRKAGFPFAYSRTRKGWNRIEVMG